MALSLTSGIILLFSYFVHVCVQEWLEATGHKKEIVDLEIAKHKKQWNFPTVQHSFWAGLWTASTGHWLSPYLLSTYQTHYNLLQLLDSFALHMPGKHRQHTTNQPTHKQQQHTNNTNTSHSSKAPGEPLYNHAGHSFFLVIACHFTSPLLAYFIYFHRYTKIACLFLILCVREVLLLNWCGVHARWWRNLHVCALKTKPT